MLHVLDILAHALKQVPAPSFTLEKALSLLRIARIPIAVPAAIIGPDSLVPAFTLVTSVTLAASPRQVKPVLACPALWVLNTNHRRPVARLPKHFLPPASRLRHKPQTRSVRRQRTATLKRAELRR